MLKHITGDLFNCEVEIAVHQANCFHTMGSGIALYIRENYPEAYKADLVTKKGDPEKLGTYSMAPALSASERSPLLYIVNMYSQFEYGRNHRYTDYEAVAKGFTLLRDNLVKDDKESYIVGVPWKYGCNVAGGDWRVVEAILNSVFENSPITMCICKKPDAEALNQAILEKPSQ